MVNTKAVAGSAVLIVAALFLLILGGALSGTWWPLFVLVPLLMLPVPLVMCGGVDDGNFMQPGPSGMKVFGFMVMGMLFVSSFALLFVLYHADSINGQSLGVSLGSVALFYIGGGVLGIYGDGNNYRGF